jgi:hypothetical protein
MIKTFSILALFSFFCFTGAKELPTFTLICEQGETPEICLNQEVNLEAQMVRPGKDQAVILQHPQMCPPIGACFQSQTVISSNMGQVNLLSEEEIPCNNVGLRGTLSKYSQGCEAGEKGKCEYQSYVVQVKSFTCLR